RICSRWRRRRSTRRSPRRAAITRARSPRGVRPSSWSGSCNTDEPPAWFYPIRQSLGAALLEAGRPAEAEVEFRAALARYPRDGRLLFGLMQSLRAAQRETEASLVEAQFDDAWEGTTE